MLNRALKVRDHAAGTDSYTRPIDIPSTVRYDAIVFDMDGVLVTGYETPATVYERAAALTMRAFAHPEPAPTALIDPDDADHVRRTCREFELPAGSAWGYRERAASQFEHELIETGDRVAFPDAAVLAELADHYRIGIASNNRHDTVEFCISWFEWTEYIDAFRGRAPSLEDYDRMKPDPAYLEHVVEALGASRPLFVGDRASDIRTAERLECDAAYLERDQSAPELTVEPTMRLESLADLPDRLAE